MVVPFLGHNRVSFVVYIRKPRLKTFGGIMEYSEVYGNLFTSDPKYKLGHCIAADAGMGRGIAVDFVKKFPRIKFLRQMDLKVGTTYFVDPVFNIVTKRKSSGKPSYESMCDALKSLKEECINNEVKYLALPKIGCGLDQLSWGAVRVMIQDIFKDMEIEIVVYSI